MLKQRLTARDLARAIDELPKDQAYSYIDRKNTGRIHIIDVQNETIRIKRTNPRKGKPLNTAKTESISSQMLWRIANAFIPSQPINFDRILGASYNTRSALEALLAHTPEFYICYPKRIEIVNSSSEIKKGHKHLVWLPNNPHKPDIIQEWKTDITISEIPSDSVTYESLSIPTNNLDGKIDIDVARRHAQMQIALVLIGRQLGYRTWVARNDRAIVYDNQPLGTLQGVIAKLEDEAIISSYQNAINTALLIDCIWFRNSRFMPAVIEIEHSTGVTSGLTRMRKLYDTIPPIETRFVIVAADEERNKVINEANMPQFRDMNPRFFPYSAVEELYALCQRRKLDGKGITDKFLDYYMEAIVE